MTKVSKPRPPASSSGAKPLGRPPVAKAAAPVAAKPAPSVPILAEPATPPALAATPQSVAPAPKPAPVAAPAPVVAAPPAPEPVAVTPPPVPEPVTPPITEAVAKTDTPAAAKETVMDTFNTAAATDKAQTVFADLNTRAKTAFEKSGKLFEEANAFSKGNLEAVVESSKIAAKGIEALGQDAAEYGRKSFEHATATFKNLSTVKSPTDFFKLQSEFVRGAFDAFVAESSRSTEAVLKLAGEVAQPLSSRAALAVEKVKQSA